VGGEDGLLSKARLRCLLVADVMSGLIQNIGTLRSVLYRGHSDDVSNIPKAPYTFSVKLSNFTVWRHTWRKNWVNYAVLTGNSAGLRNVFSSRLSHTELRISLRESHSFLSLHADTTMVSSKDTQTSKMNKRGDPCVHWSVQIVTWTLGHTK
jgi:hypothetical protein